MVTIYDSAAKWVQKQNVPFTVCDFKKYYLESQGKECSNKIGGVFVKLKDNNLIKDTERVEKSKDKAAKGRKVTVWISVAFSNKQRAKRELEETRILRETQYDIFEKQA